MLPATHISAVTGGQDQRYTPATSTWFQYTPGLNWPIIAAKGQTVRSLPHFPSIPCRCPSKWLVSWCTSTANRHPPAQAVPPPSSDILTCTGRTLVACSWRWKRPVLQNTPPRGRHRCSGSSVAVLRTQRALPQATTDNCQSDVGSTRSLHQTSTQPPFSRSPFARQHAAQQTPSLLSPQRPQEVTHTTPSATKVTTPPHPLLPLMCCSVVLASTA